MAEADEKSEKDLGNDDLEKNPDLANKKCLLSGDIVMSVFS